MIMMMKNPQILDLGRHNQSVEQGLPGDSGVCSALAGLAGFCIITSEMNSSNKIQENELFRLAKNKVTYFFGSAYVVPITAWFIWIVMGTLFYSTKNNLGWAKGFYMAVNIGYSIGWGYPIEIDSTVKIFSCVYILIGSSAVAAALGYFAEHIVSRSKIWYADAILRDELHHDGSIYSRLKIWLQLESNKLRSILIWILMLILMLGWSLACVKWDFIDALYFAVSSLSTAGAWAIPDDSPDWYFGVVGLFAAMGVPLMGYAMSSIATMVFHFGDPKAAKAAVCAPFTAEEILFMRTLGLENGDGKLDKAEFILLCALRLGALDESLVHTISEQFHLLDAADGESDGSVDYTLVLGSGNHDDDVSLLHRIAGGNRDDDVSLLQRRVHAR